jgi:transcriptional antiterminator RfaH
MVKNDHVRSFGLESKIQEPTFVLEKSGGMVADPLAAAPEGQREWICVRTHPKHEHIAAARLSHIDGIEVFNPRLRMERLTRRGRVCFTESLFVNYVFARFVLETMLERVRFTPSVKSIVQFGSRPATIAESVIDELRLTVAQSADTVFTDAPLEGDVAEVLEGPFCGELVTVERVLSARQRVEVLMEVLGRPLAVEFSLTSLIFKRRPAVQQLLGAAPANGSELVCAAAT